MPGLWRGRRGGWGVAGGTVAATWGHCLALLPHTAAGLSSPHSPSPPPPFFVWSRARSRARDLMSRLVRPSAGWSVALSLFVPFSFRWGHFGVCLGHVGSFLGQFGSFWGRFGSLWVVLVTWVSHVTHGRWPCSFFLGKPQFFGVPPVYFNVDLACLCTCMFLACIRGLPRQNAVAYRTLCVLFLLQILNKEPARDPPRFEM